MPAAETNNEHVLATDAFMRAQEEAWHRAWPLVKPFSTQPLPNITTDVWAPPQVEFWVRFLEQHADAMNSRDIFDDLMVALSVMPNDQGRWAAPPVRKKIFERALALLATVTAADIVLPWVCNENRPALRLRVEDVEIILSNSSTGELSRQKYRQKPHQC